MTYVATLSTPSIVINEYDTVSLNLTLNIVPSYGDFLPYQYKIFGITATGTNKYPLPYTISADGQTLSLNGQVADVFDRYVEYLDVNYAKQRVTRFADLPDNYMAIYHYQPPAVSSTILTYQVDYSVDGSTDVAHQLTPTDSAVFTIVVNTNFAISNQAFQLAIANGALTRKAKAKGRL